MLGLPVPTHTWCVDDLEDMPDESYRFELIDGLLLVTPSPGSLHQRTVLNLMLLLHNAIPDSLEVFSIVAWQPDRHTSFQPDVLAARREDVGEFGITEPLVLAVEVLTKATRHKDLQLKYAKYEEAGVAHYWVVDPEVPSFTSYELYEGRYRVVVDVKGDDVAKVTTPVEVELTPSSMIVR